MSIVVVCWIALGLQIAVLATWLAAAAALAWWSARLKGGTASWDGSTGRATEGPRIAPARSETLPRLTVYVAAHNEEGRIRACVERLLAQDYPRLTIVVVDDRSTDATAEIVRGMMAADSRLRLFQVEHLPDGWVGKTHALARATADVLEGGSAAGEGDESQDYLLFLDSDCRLADGALREILQRATRDHLGYVTLIPWVELRSWSERLLTPPAMLALGVDSLWAILRRGSARGAAVGNGQFMLFSRAAYRHVGGHAAVAAELAEDAMLARRITGAGLPRWVGLGAGRYVTSRDNRLGGTVHALTRICIGTLGSTWRLFASTQVLTGGCFLPIATAALGIAAWARGVPCGRTLAAAALLHMAVMLLTLRTLFRFTIVRPGALLLFPIGALLSALILFRACWVIHGRGAVRWGRARYTVRGSRIESLLRMSEPTGSAAR